MNKSGCEFDHSKCIIHIDLDCYYAQVEQIKNPELEKVPFAVYQKHIVVTSNYKARECNITKCMTIKDAQKRCPDLVLVNGEDLYDYRQTSQKVTAFLERYSKTVERLGFDENYLDVTGLVNDKMKARGEFKTAGHVYGQVEDVCDCGCYDRLRVASVVAQDIRDSLWREMKLTSRAGISHNKLLSKLAGAVHKPNQQTIVFPNNAMELMLSLSSVRSVPGIGSKTAETLEHLDIVSIEDLQNASVELLQKAFPIDKAKYLKNLSYGNDPSPVKKSGKPLSIGLEDACRTITAESGVKEKVAQLLKRLMVLVNEDCRTPTTIKLTIRRSDNSNKATHRESKQCNVNPTLFTSSAKGIAMSESSEQKLLTLVMRLFNRMVNEKRPYHLTLIGVSFTKFQENVTGKSSIKHFLKKDVEVQAITNIENIVDDSTMDYSNNSQSEFNTDGSETEVEPSPKKKKLSTLIARRRCFNLDCPSPSKLKVSELRINSRDSPEILTDQDEIQCPPDVDVDVFRELPKEVREELWADYLRQREREQKVVHQIKKPKLNTLHNYFVKN